MNYTHTRSASVLLKTLRSLKAWHILLLTLLGLGMLLAGPTTKLLRPVKAAATYFVRTDGSDTLCNGTANASSASAPNCAFATIQHAVDVAAANGMSGDIINVAAGTYAEAIDISEAGLTINGPNANTPATTNCNGTGRVTEAIVGNADNAFNIQANNVVIKGFTLSGNTNNLPDGAAVVIGPTASGVQLLNNIVQNNIAGVLLGGDNSTFQGNLFQNNNNSGSVSGTGIYWDQFISGGTLTTATITANCFINNESAGVLFGGDDPTQPATGITISNNTFTGNGNAIGLFTVTSSSITGNTISNSTASQVLLGGNVNGLNITNNTIINGATRGIRVQDALGVPSPNTNIAVSCNRIVNNPAGGLVVDAGGLVGVLSATNNWWGCNAGPGNPGCNAVTNASAGTVTFNPWLILTLTANPPSPITGQMSTLTASLLTNSAGAPSGCSLNWFPVPVAFASTCGTVNPTNTTTTNGTAASTLTAGNTAGGCTSSTTIDNQTVQISQTVACPTITVSPVSPTLPTGAVGVAYSQTFTASGGLAPYTFSAPPANLPPGLTLSSGGLLSGTPTAAGNFTFTVTATAANGCTGSRTYTLLINPQAIVTVVDQFGCTRPGDVLTVTTTVTNPAGTTQDVSFTATLPTTSGANLIGVPGTGTSTVGAAPTVSAASVSFGPVSLAAGQTVVVTYQVQVGDLVPSGASLCISTTVNFTSSPSTTALACITVNCAAIGPGLLFPATAEVSDQKAGSVLYYNLYSSSIAAPNGQNTRISLTNINPNQAIAVHLFFVDGATCSIADSLVCLTPNQTASFLASDVDPGTTGYIVAVASDLVTGCPINFNYLIGDEYVKLSSGHAANLTAEAFAALAGGPVACNANSVTTVLNFDNVSYNRAPRVLAASNIPSRADGNDTLIVLNRVGGSLAAGAATLGSLFGILYDDAENPLSFTFTAGVCQFRSSLSSSFPRTAPRFEQFIPAGRSGWAKFYSLSDIGLLGAQINFNPNTATAANAFNQGHNLHKLTLTSAATLTIPIFPPNC